MVKKNSYAKKKQYANDGTRNGRYYSTGLIPYDTIRCICKGDNNAFEEVVKRYEKSAWRWAKDIAENEFDVKCLYGDEQDMTQTIWESLQELLKNGFKLKESKRGTEKEFVTYIERAVKNFLRNEIRKELPKLKYEESMDPNRVDNSYRQRRSKGEGEHEICIWKIVIPFRDRRLIKILEKGLSGLETRHRKVLEQAMLNNFKKDAIAELLELEEKSVENYLSEAIGILKKYKEDGDR